MGDVRSRAPEARGERQTLTERAAAAFAALAQRLRERGHEPQEVAQFVNRMVFCMFALTVDEVVCWLRNAKGTKVTDLQIKALRNKHANCCIEVEDGTAYSALGRGITGAGTNALDTMRSIYLRRWAGEQTSQVLSAMPGVIDRARAANIEGRMFADVIEFRLRILDDHDTCWVLDDIRSGYRHPLMSPFR